MCQLSQSLLVGELHISVVSFFFFFHISYAGNAVELELAFSFSSSTTSVAFFFLTVEKKFARDGSAAAAALWPSNSVPGR